MTAVENARSKLGAPYVWGAKGPDSFDCSGLFRWSWAQDGVDVPGFTDAIADALPRVSGPPRAGDAILYRYDDPSQPGVRFPHVDMSEGGDRVIGARFSMGGVVEGSILGYPFEIHRPVSVAGESVATIAGDSRNWLAIGGAALALAWALDLI